MMVEGMSNDDIPVLTTTKPKTYATASGTYTERKFRSKLARLYAKTQDRARRATTAVQRANDKRARKNAKRLAAGGHC